MSDNKEIHKNEIHENNANEDIRSFVLNSGSETGSVYEAEDEEVFKPGKWLKIIIIVLIVVLVGTFIAVSIFFSKKTYRSYDVVAT